MVEKSLTSEQQWLVVLYEALFKIAHFAATGKIYESYTLVSHYEHLIADLILNEIDSDWYEKRGSELDQEFEDPRIFSRKRDPKRLRLEKQARLSTLKVGQLVDGSVK